MSIHPFLKRPHVPALLAAVAMTIVFCAVCLYQLNDASNDSSLGRNPDAFLRMVKVLQLWETGDWQNHLLQRDNAPYGMVLQWTRVLDILLLAGALPLSLFFSKTASLYYWAFLLPPLFMVLQVYVTTRIAIRLGMEGITLFYVALASTFNIFILGQFQPLAADHHFLLTFLSTLSFYYALRLIQTPTKNIAIVRLAAAMSVGLWVAPEFLITIAIILGTLGILYVANPEPYTRALRLVPRWMTGLLLLAVISELSDITEIRHDSLSIVHVTMFALGSLITTITTLLHRNKPWQRAGLLLAGCLFALLVISLLFPGFSKGPGYHVSPFMQEHFLNNVSEFQPLYNWHYVPQLYHLLAMAVPMLALFLLPRYRPLFRQMPAPMLLIASGAIIWMVLGILHNRLAVYAPPLIVILGAFVITDINRWMQRTSVLATMPTFKQVIPLLALLLFPYTVCGDNNDSATPSQTAEMSALMDDEQECQYSYIRLLEQGTFTALLPPGSRIILADNNIAPFILFYTTMNTVASNSHRNEAGYKDLHTLLTSTDTPAIKTMLERRKADVIALCRLPRGYRVKESLYDALHKGKVPAWLEKVENKKLQGALLLTMKKGDT